MKFQLSKDVSQFGLSLQAVAAFSGTFDSVIHRVRDSAPDGSSPRVLGRFEESSRDSFVGVFYPLIPCSFCYVFFESRLSRLCLLSR